MVVIKEVAVIGGGLAGLGAVKWLKEEGLEPICFEKTDYIGGLWHYHDDDVEERASVMKSTIINTSKEMGAFSDFPPPADYPNYMHHTLMYKYIHMAATKYDVLKHIKYHHETKKIEKANDYEETGRWKVTNFNTKTKELITEVFDGVVVCIGHHVYPNMPTFVNQEKFKGKIIHTHSLKKAEGFEDQRVVVVGVGNSGMDAAVELSSVTKQVYLSSRRGTWVLPRVGPKGYPIDYVYLRRYWLILRRLMPNWVQNLFLENVLSRFDHALYNLKPNHGLFSQHPTISDSLPIKLLSGVVAVRGNIKEFTKNGVIFEGEEEETEVDSCLLATGYKIKFSFLSEDLVPVVNNRVQLYKYIYPPHLTHPTLAILGLVQPAGAGIPVGEMQCRWTARIMSGKHKLPTKEKMLADIQEKDNLNRKNFVNSPRHTLQVDFIEYPDELAKEIGAKPNLLKLFFTDFKLFVSLCFGPSLSYQYRLQGPHSWSGARDAILTCKDRIVEPLQKRKHHKYYQSKNQFLSELKSKWFLLFVVFSIFLLVLVI